MAEDIKDVENETAEKKRPGKIRRLFKRMFGSKKAVLITMMLFILLLGLAAGGGLFFFNSRDTGEEYIETQVNDGDTIEFAIKPESEIIFEDVVDLEPFERIRLKSGSTMRRVSIAMSLELTDHNYRKEIIAMEDRIREIITGQMAEMTWLELRNPEGKIMLKYDLLKRINSIFPKTIVRNIYFTTFIMQ